MVIWCGRSGEVPCGLLSLASAGGGLARPGGGHRASVHASADLWDRGAAALCAGCCQRRVGTTLGPAQVQDREQEGALVLQ
jgi:hypothetical protein